MQQWSKKAVRNGIQPCHYLAEPQYFIRSFQVVSQKEQCHFCSHLSSSSKQKVVSMHGVLDCPKRMLHNLLPKPVNVHVFLHSLVGFFVNLCVLTSGYRPETPLAFRTNIAVFTVQASLFVVIISACCRFFAVRIKSLSSRACVCVFFFIV